MHLEDRILVTGSTGMVGKSLLQLLKQEGFHRILHPTHAELDLTEQAAVHDYFKQHQPQYVFHLAARVGGIEANRTFTAEFIYQNTAMHINVIHSAYQAGVKKLLFPGSACTYPRLANQPIQSSDFLNGPVEPTNIAYAAAKINGIVMCQSYAKQYGFNVTIPMPTNAYGAGDNFDPKASHVIPALMQRFHDAKLNHLAEVVLWGTGAPLREFIYVTDLADALLFLMQHYDSSEIINVGTLVEISIGALAELIANTVGYTGKITLDISKPDGMPRKCLDSRTLFDLGWKPKIALQQGLSRMYQYHFINEKVEAVV
jgi:GDP-L-fucose synthase